MGSKTPPCNARENRFYNGGKVCSKCAICPAGQGRDMSKRVLNTIKGHGDLECIQCELCPTKTYNNGGKEGCKKCLDDCAGRNRYDCPERATQLCGKCLDGYFEEYQIEDNPSTCIPCSEKEKSIIPACANFTTIVPSVTFTAIDTTPLSSKTTKYIQNRTDDRPVSGKNIPAVVQNKSVQSNYENSPSGLGYWKASLLAMGALTTVIVVLLVIWVICRYYKKRRRRQSETDQGIRTAGTSRNSVNSPLLSSTSGNYIDGPHLAGTSTNSFDTQLLAGISGSSVDRPLPAGASGNLVDSPHMAGTTGNSVDGPLLPGTSGNPVDSPLLAGSSGNSVGFPLLVGTYGNADDNKVAFDVYTVENDLETDTKPVLKRLDRNGWIDRQELLKSKVSIHQLCAKRWIALDSEYPVFSMPNKEVELLKKEAHSKDWTPEELNYKILSRWTQIKGNQATVQALCDALLENEHYDIIEDIMKENP